MGAVCATIPNINANICTNIAIAGSKVYEDSKFIDSSVELSFSCRQPATALAFYSRDFRRNIIALTAQSDSMH